MILESTTQDLIPKNEPKQPADTPRAETKRPSRRIEVTRALSKNEPNVMVSTNWYNDLKDFVEFCLAFVLALLALPVILTCALLVKLTSRGPAFYSQIRVGINGRPFRIYKIRTMAQNAENGTGATWATPGDSRITLVGNFLRKTHLDELPQLWNVLMGDMSLVGPRPERPEFVPSLEKAVPLYRSRLLVRPGVTGLAQVQLPADTDIESVRKKLAYDLYYVQQFNFWLDVRLMISTGLHMFGVPYGLLSKIFRIPKQDAVESAYGQLVEKHS